MKGRKAGERATSVIVSTIKKKKNMVLGNPNKFHLGEIPTPLKKKVIPL